MFHTFALTSTEVIGANLGSVVISMETLNFLNAPEAKIQVKKNCGLIPATIEINEEKGKTFS